MAITYTRIEIPNSSSYTLGITSSSMTFTTIEIGSSPTYTDPFVTTDTLISVTGEKVISVGGEEIEVIVD